MGPDAPSSHSTSACTSCDGASAVFTIPYHRKKKTLVQVVAVPLADSVMECTIVWTNDATSRLFVFFFYVCVCVLGKHDRTSRGTRLSLHLYSENTESIDDSASNTFLMGHNTAISLVRLVVVRLPVCAIYYQSIITAI